MQNDSYNFCFKNRNVSIMDTHIKYEFGIITHSISAPSEFIIINEPIEFYHFHTGRRLILRLRNNEDEINISFRSFFGRRRTEMFEVFESMYNRIWALFFEETVDCHLQDLQEGKDVRIGCFTLNNQELSSNSKNETITIKTDEAVLNWMHEKLVVTSSRDLNYLFIVENHWHWNAVIVQYLIEKLCPSSN